MPRTSPSCYTRTLRPLLLLVLLALTALYASFLSGTEEEEGEALVAARPVSAYLTAEAKVGPQDTIYDILRAEGVSPQEVLALVKAASPHYDLCKIRPGHWYEVTCTREAQLRRFAYQIDMSSQLTAERHNGVFHAAIEPLRRGVKRCAVAGTISSSLFEAIQQIGEHPQLAFDLADVFAWNIDFHVDLRRGDWFAAVVEKLHLRGEFVGYGPMQGAQFYNDGSLHTAILFRDPDGRVDYFSPDGQSLRKQFLKSPLKYTRISSRFSYRRLHPILKVVRPHLGVDYAAPMGTPVVSVGDGRVLKANYGRGNGNYVVVRHNAKYTTMYLHLSRFAAGIRAGVEVRQGDVIGYVGSTGLSTGPHLDFRMKERRRFVDPLTVEVPAADPVREKYWDEFCRVRDEVMGRLAPLNSSLDLNASTTASLEK